jgi:segregation and condensation protein A
VTVGEAMEEMVDELRRAGRISFRRLTDGLVERIEVIVRFLAVLEMFKQGLVEIDQAETFGEIEILWVGADVDARVSAGLIDDYEG